MRRLRASIRVLERRRLHLLDKLDDGAYARTNSAQYDRAESSALEQAIALMVARMEVVT